MIPCADMIYILFTTISTNTLCHKSIAVTLSIFFNKEQNTKQRVTEHVMVKKRDNGPEISLRRIPNDKRYLTLCTE